MPRSHDALDTLTDKNRQRSSGSTTTSPKSTLLFAPSTAAGGKKGSANQQQSLNDEAGTYAPPAYSHTTAVPDVRRESLLSRDTSLAVPRPDNVSYSSSETEVTNTSLTGRRKGRGRIGDNNPLPAEELADTPNLTVTRRSMESPKGSPVHGESSFHRNLEESSFNGPTTRNSSGNNNNNEYNNSPMNSNRSPRLDGKRGSNLMTRQSSQLPNNSMVGGRNSTRYSKRGESNLNGMDPANQSPRATFTEAIRDVGEQFVDIVKNKSRRHLRSHDELTMSPFQKFIHYGRFPCKLVLSTLIVILITVLIFTFELPNSLNDENERKQLIELFMDAIDVDGASGRREPGEDYTFVPKLFLSTQESVLAAMANVGQLYYNITRESLCDLDFFFNDDFEDFPRNFTVDASYHSSVRRSLLSAEDASSSSSETLTVVDDKQQQQQQSVYERHAAKRNKRAHPSLKRIVKSDSIDSNLPSELHPEAILSDLMKQSHERLSARATAARARQVKSGNNNDGRMKSFKGGAPSLDAMGDRLSRRSRSSSPSAAAASSDSFAKFFGKKAGGDGAADSTTVTPPPSRKGKGASSSSSSNGDGSSAMTNRVYFPAMRGGGAVPPANGVARRFSVADDDSNTAVGVTSHHHVNSYYEYVRYLFMSGQIKDEFFINSTWVQPPTLTVRYMRSSPRVDWAAANAPLRSESYAVTLDNLLGPFILAPDADDGSSDPTPGDVLPVWSFSICAPREDPLFDGHFFLPCRDSIDQSENDTMAAIRNGEPLRLTAKRPLPGSTSSLRKLEREASGTALSGRMARRAKKASRYFKSLAAASNVANGGADSLSADAAAGGKKSLVNALTKASRNSRRRSSGVNSRVFGASAIDGDADRLFTPFGIFDTSDDAVIDMYIHQLFTASNSKNPQFSDLFYQDSIYVWHVQVFFDLDTNGLATVTVEVDNQVRRNHSSFQTIFFLLILLLTFAVWDACLRVRGLHSILHLKRMIRKRLESLRREQVRRAWAKAKAQEEHDGVYGGGLQKLFATTKRSNRDDRDAVVGGSGASNHSSANNLAQQLLSADNHHQAEVRNAQSARQGGLLAVGGGASSKRLAPSGSSGNISGESGDENEHQTLINNANSYAASDYDHQQTFAHHHHSRGGLGSRFVRAWKDLFGIVDSDYQNRVAASNAAAARGPANPNAFIHPITRKVLTDHELQQLERKCRKSLKSDVGMSWQFLAIVCDILCAIYVCFAIAQATSLTVSSSAVRMERIILGVAGLFSSILLVSYLRFFPKFYFMIRATSAALPRVILFYIGVLPIFFAFSIFWVTVFGSYSKGQFDSLTRSIATLYCCMFGDNLLPTFQVAMNNDSYEIYFLGAFVTFAFIAFFMFAVLNLTMSIVMDSFDNVKEKYGLQVDDPSQQYLQYGSKGVMAMKAAEQKQIEAVREIREQLGVIAKTLPIINGGKSRRADRRNKAKNKVKPVTHHHSKNGGVVSPTSPSMLNSRREDGDDMPPSLSISASEYPTASLGGKKSTTTTSGNTLMPPTSAAAASSNVSDSLLTTPTRQQPTPHSPTLTNEDALDDDEDEDEDLYDDENDNDALQMSEATKVTKAKFDNKYHEFMMEPGLDEDLLEHLQTNYDERDEADNGDGDGDSNDREDA